MEFNKKLLAMRRVSSYIINNRVCIYFKKNLIKEERIYEVRHYQTGVKFKR
jgi:hypothetical protein